MASVHCSFCEKSQDELDVLVSGPDEVFICNECTTKAQEAIWKFGAPFGFKDPMHPYCSFCGKNTQEVKAFYVKPDSKLCICDECVDLLQTLFSPPPRLVTL